MSAEKVMNKTIGSELGNNQPGVVKFSQGVAESWYREVIHMSTKKVEKIKKLLGSDGAAGYEINVEVFILEKTKKEYERR